MEPRPAALQRVLQQRQVGPEVLRPLEDLLSIVTPATNVVHSADLIPLTWTRHVPPEMMGSPTLGAVASLHRMAPNRT